MEGKPAEGTPTQWQNKPRRTSSGSGAPEETQEGRPRRKTPTVGRTKEQEEARKERREQEEKQKQEQEREQERQRREFVNSFLAFNASAIYYYVKHEGQDIVLVADGTDLKNMLVAWVNDPTQTGYLDYFLRLSNNGETIYVDLAGGLKIGYQAHDDLHLLVDTEVLNKDLQWRDRIFNLLKGNPGNADLIYRAAIEQGGFGHKYNPLVWATQEDGGPGLNYIVNYDNNPLFYTTPASLAGDYLTNLLCPLAEETLQGVCYKRDGKAVFTKGNLRMLTNYVKSTLDPDREIELDPDATA